MVKQVGETKMHKVATQSMRQQGHDAVEFHSVSVVCQCRYGELEGVPFSEEANLSLGYGLVNCDPDGPSYSEKETKQEIKYSFRDPDNSESTIFWRGNRASTDGRQDDVHTFSGEGELRVCQRNVRGGSTRTCVNRSHKFPHRHTSENTRLHTAHRLRHRHKQTHTHTHTL